MASELKILMLEDNPSDVKLIEKELYRGEFHFESKVVETELEFKDALISYEPDLILSDYSLPTYNGMLALDYVRETMPDIAFILVTGSLNEEIAVECMKSGADDYILKDNLKRLAHSIKIAIRNKKDRLEKKLAMQALRESEERYRSLFNISPDAIIVHNNDVITFANQSAADLIGFSFAYELIGLKASSFVHPKSLPIERDRINALTFGAKKVPPAEEKFIKRDGTVIDVETIATHFSIGDESSILMIVRDISERKKIELELLQAKEKAEKSSNFKTALMANMSHEFRTPMNGILGFAQILKEELATDSRINMVNSIIRSSKRLMQTLNSILDLSQIEADKLDAKIKIEDIGALILYISKFYEMDFQEKKIRFCVTIKDKELFCNLDEDLFKEILSNLLDNALKFTYEGIVEVIAEKFVDANNKSWVLIRVIDTGIGIAKEDQEIIFEPFKQISEGTSRSYEGSGLGLTITRKMVELLDGKITLESALEHGATFLLYFPLVGQAPESEAIKPVKTLTETAPLEKNAKFPEVLLVEDNFINKEVTILYLKNICKVDHAANGEKAVLMASEKKYDLILMDINLGAGMDGIQALKHIKQIDSYKDTPIVALTGYTLREDKDRFLNEGFSHYLSKPFEKFDLVDLTQEILRIPKTD
ncbi:MAG: response regulator [Bacteroidota bacterium]|nr:response regulator [Bacteroidota bacterium]